MEKLTQSLSARPRLETLLDAHGRSFGPKIFAHLNTPHGVAQVTRGAAYTRLVFLRVKSAISAVITTELLKGVGLWSVWYVDFANSLFFSNTTRT